MNEDASSGPPAWMPASVGSAYRHGPGTDDDLVSGRAWKGLLDVLDRAGAVLQSDRSPADAGRPGCGLPASSGPACARHRRGAAAHRDPYRPAFRPGQRRQRPQVGHGLPRRRLHGVGHPWWTPPTGSRAGGAPSATSVSRSWRAWRTPPTWWPTTSTIDHDGSFELVLSADRAAGELDAPPGSRPRWWSGSSSTTGPTRSRPTWRSSASAPLRRRTGRVSPGAALSAAGVAPQLGALGGFVEASIEFWLDIEEGGRAQGLNRFREPAALTAHGCGGRERERVGIVAARGRRGPSHRGRPRPTALYWSVSLGNYWWETIDYANRQSSLNGHQAVVDDDGVFRAVVVAPRSRDRQLARHRRQPARAR